jgi:hypothetical protein
MVRPIAGRRHELPAVALAYLWLAFNAVLRVSRGYILA